MNEFKYGDRVRRIKNPCDHGGMKTGDEDRVVGLLGKSILILSKFGGGHNSENFELVPNEFSRNDLETGMMLFYEDGTQVLVLDGRLYIYVQRNHRLTDAGTVSGVLTTTLRNRAQSLLHMRGDVMKVVDRDGTVVFRREDESIEVTLKLTKEQVEDLKRQGISINAV